MKVPWESLTETKKIFKKAYEDKLVVCTKTSKPSDKLKCLEEIHRFNRGDKTSSFIMQDKDFKEALFE